MKKYAEAERGSQPGSQKMPWDPYIDYKFMARCNDAWMSLWKSLKPTIAKINGVAIGGGSDMALVCDITIATNDTLIGYPPSRVWGCPTSAMWFYRVGMERAKRILFTGDTCLSLCLDYKVTGSKLPRKDSRVNRTVVCFNIDGCNTCVENMPTFSLVTSMLIPC